MKHYLAYGSNLNIEQMKVRCPGARIVGTATLDGWHLLFKGSKTGSYLTIEESDKGRVPMAVWAVNEAHEASLDRYEGYPMFYYKRPLSVTLDQALADGYIAGQRIESFVYIMHEERTEGIPTDWYVDACLEGYESFGFNPKYIYDAVYHAIVNRKEANCYEVSNM